MSGRDEGSPVLPDRPDDEHDIGWGEPLRDTDTDADEEATRRLLDERPPHHLDGGD